MMWLLALACGGKDPAPKPDALSEPTIEVPDAIESEWGDVVEPEPPVANTRQLKRMTVAQVRDSMERITGGIPWGGVGNSNWDDFAETLTITN